ncbi:NADPH-dependent FMN reductase [Fictibacillus sp. KU28468]|uniref:NADPH-dependent FMN reductase n=1 Tax=Fictibacillus sp. KU28468 TaxID=2991053 RepID=UPI00223E66D9|nr:NADPH-dependent FMN reductase [Fictibacillus sp. KU28468]UZJ77900.1 NADPH-dependent FMN reductase [Fictibacillus sp. KU28468]
MADIVTISGSPSVTSRTGIVLRYLSELSQKGGLETESFSVLDVPPEDLVLGHFQSPHLKAIEKSIKQAKAVIIGTPVYKAAYSGVLKSLLDLLPQDILSGKSVLPIATGGTIAHLLSIEYALKPVLNAIGARNILNGIYLIDLQLEHNNGRDVAFDQEIEKRLIVSLNELIDEVKKDTYIKDLEKAELQIAGNIDGKGNKA